MSSPDARDFPLVRIRKLLPDGTLKVVVFAYRLPDYDGWARLLIPNGTTRLHTRGTWTPDGLTIAALDPQRPYVVHWWRGPAASGFYVDIARSIEIRADVVDYVDLLLDLSSVDGHWKTLDEDELPQLTADDRALALRAAAEVRGLIARGDPLFDPDGTVWALPAGALELPPRQAAALE